MSRQGTGSSAVGAQDFLAKFAPNLSLKERGSLTSMVREAVRDYMDENQLMQPLAQPSQTRALAHMLQPRQRPASAMRGGGDFSGDFSDDGASDQGRQRRRPQTARGFLASTVEANAATADADAGLDGENFCLVGNSTGIPTDTPRYAMVSSRFAPLPATAPTFRRHAFPATLMGFASVPEARLVEDGAAFTLKEQPQPQKKDAAPNDQPAKAPPAPHVKRPATANWLSWRGATPFCASDRELRAFRHRQNPRKPMPEELPHFALYGGGGGGGSRLLTGAGPLTARGTLGANDPGAALIDRSIGDWVKGASEQDKTVVLSLMKAIGSGRTEGLEAFRGDAQPQLSSFPRPEDHTFGRRTRPPTPRTVTMRSLPETFDSSAPKVLFHGVENTYKYARSRVHPLRPAFDYMHPGAGFTNAMPPYRSNFVVHPDWVSELAAPNPAPQPRGPGRGGDSPAKLTGSGDRA